MMHQILQEACINLVPFLQQIGVNLHRILVHGEGVAAAEGGDGGGSSCEGRAGVGVGCGRVGERAGLGEAGRGRGGVGLANVFDAVGLVAAVGIRCSIGIAV